MDPGDVEVQEGEADAGRTDDRELDAWSDAASRDTMRMLDQEDTEAGFSWEDASAHANAREAIREEPW